MDRTVNAVIFDMDGILLDSEVLYIECWHEIAEEKHIEDLDSILSDCAGVTIQAAEQVFIRKYGPDVPYWEYRRAVMERYDEKYKIKKFPLKPGAQEILDWLRERRVPMALATSTAGELAMMELDDFGFTPYFGAIITGDMCSRSKPAPDIFLTAAEGIGADPGHTLVLEDSFDGIRAAHNAGMIPVMVPDARQPSDEIRSLARHVFRDLFEVMDWLDNGVLVSGGQK